MPWTGGAFLVGAMAIAGLPPLNGFASEWLTLQALLHVAAYGGVGDGLAGAIALAALAATAALAVFCFVKVVGLVLLGPPRRDAVAAAVEAPVPMRAAVVAARRRVRRARRRARPALRPRSSGSRRGRPPLPTARRPAPARHRIAADRRDRGRARRRSTARSSLAARAPRRRARADWACGQLVEPRSRWTSAGFTKPLRLVLEAVLRPEREIDGAHAAAASCRRSRTAAACRI